MQKILPTEILEAIANEKKAANKIKTPKTLQNSHRIVKAWLEEDKKIPEITFGYIVF